MSLTSVTTSNVSSLTPLNHKQFFFPPLHLCVLMDGASCSPWKLEKNRQKNDSG